MDKTNISLTQEEIELIYAACMAYGTQLADMVKAIPNEPEIADSLVNKASKCWKLARDITVYMNE
jgi:hypothetical protein